jgi:hypothetical protein
MKNALTAYSCSMLIACSATVQAQTNTFPAEGNVGIGTNNPRGALHIVRPGRPPPVRREQNGLLLGSRSTTEFKWIQSYGALLAVIPQGNNVAIGHSTATHRLDLDGAARIRPNTATNLLISGQGDDIFLDLIKNTTTVPSARVELNGLTDQRAHDGEIADPRSSEISLHLDLSGGARLVVFALVVGCLTRGQGAPVQVPAGGAKETEMSSRS